MTRSFAYQPALDGLRGLAVAGVVAYHLDWIPGGFLGVDAFFVLSGFLITTLLLVEHDRTGRVGLRDFWARRARRLLPALFLLVGALVLFERSAVERVDVLATLAYVANWHQIGIGDSYFELFAEPSPLRHAWSLAVEEQFYVLWPLLFVGAMRVGGRRALGALCAGGIVASAVAMAAWYVPGDPSRVYYGTDTRAQLLLLGALAAVVSLRGIPVWIGAPALGASVVAMLTVADTAAWLYRGGMLLHAFAVVLVLGSVTGNERSWFARMLGWEPLRRLGVVSYGVYLWHWPVIVLCTPERTGLDGLGLDAVRLVIVAVASALSYFLVEQPVRRGTWSARPAFASAGVALAGTIAIAVATLPQQPRSDVFVTTAAPVEQLAGNRSEPVLPAPTSVTAPPAWRPVHKIAVVGDSVAASLAYGLEAIDEQHGVQVVSAAVPGCGLAAGTALGDDGYAFPWSDDCVPIVAKVLDELVANEDPDLVVWLSTWELADREQDGVHLRFGTAAYDRALRAAIDEQLRRLTVRGARVIMVPPVPQVPGRRPFPDAPPERYEAYRRTLGAIASASNGQVAVVDMTAFVCPGGPPCPQVVREIELRPDGVHFDEHSAPIAAGHLLSTLNLRDLGT